MGFGKKQSSNQWQSGVSIARCGVKWKRCQALLMAGAYILPCISKYCYQAVTTTVFLHQEGWIQILNGNVHILGA